MVLNNSMKIELTKNKIKDLKKELSGLKNRLAQHHESERDTILFSSKEAAANDVSIGAMNSRVREIENILENCEELPEETDSKKVVIGSRIEVEKGDGSSIHYRLVHPIEADPNKGYISVESPIGKLFIGSREGAIVDFKGRKFKVIFVG